MRTQPNNPEIFFEKLGIDKALCFFLLDLNGQTQVYRLVWSVRFQRNPDFPTEDDDLVGQVRTGPVGSEQVRTCQVRAGTNVLYHNVM